MLRPARSWTRLRTALEVAAGAGQGVHDDHVATRSDAWR
jgi:hypothetical protein